MSTPGISLNPLGDIVPDPGELPLRPPLVGVPAFRSALCITLTVDFNVGVLLPDENKLLHNNFMKYYIH